MTITLSWLRLPYRDFKVNEGVPRTELTRIGSFVLTSLFDGFLARFVMPRDQGVPDSGWWGPADCRPSKGTNPLDVDIFVGSGLCYSASLTSSHDLPALQPVIVASSSTKTLDAHHATLPRIDRIDVVPGWADADSGSRRVRPAGAPAVQTLNRRKDSVGTVTVTKGTPDASPSAPAAPSNSIPVALVYVPAASGDVIVTDTRRFIRPGEGQERIPDPGLPGTAYTEGVPYARSIVQTGCEVSAGTGLAVDVASGTIDHPGARCLLSAKTLTIATADATHPRYDAVYVDADAAGTPNSRPGGLTLAVETGTPATPPQRPTANTGSVILAYVYVAAGATTVSSGDITDVRPLAPYRDAMQSVVTIDPRVQCAEVNSTTRQLRIDAADADGNTVATNAIYYEIELFDGSAGALGDINTSTQAHIEITTGTVVQGDDGSGPGKSRLVVQANASGVVTGNIVLDGSAPFVVAIRVTPVRWFSGIGTTVKLDGLNGDPIRSYRPGAPIWTEIGFS